jgi:putative phosphoesterase
MIDLVIETTTGFELADKAILGILADTHVPDRVDQLHPQIIEKFKEYEVDTILHAGDISIPSVISKLETVAPVIAVRGNRDLFLINSLPMVRIMNFAGHRLALVHGHGQWRHYFINKIKMAIKGYHINIFLPTILGSIPETEVVVFGHTHRPMNVWYNTKQLLFNPGTCSSIVKPYPFPTIGILRLERGKQTNGEIIALKGERLRNRHWIKYQSNS